MLEKVLLSIWDFMRGKAVWLLLIAVLLLVPAGYGMTKVRSSAQTETVISDNSQEYKDIMQLQDRFSSQQLIILIEGDNVAGIMSEQNRAAMQYIDDKFSSYENVLFIIHPEFLFAGLKGFGVIPADASPESAIIDADTGEISSEFSELFFNHQSTAIILGLWHEFDEGEMSDLLDEIRDAIEAADFDDNVKITLTGFSVLSDWIEDATMKALAQVMSIAAVIMLIVLAVIFKMQGRIFRRWIVLGLVGVSLLYTMGLLGALDIPITQYSMTTYPILLGLGVDYAVQFHNRYDEETRQARSSNDSIVTTLRRTGVPIVIAMALCVVGLASSQLTESPQMKYFGQGIMIGVVVCMFVALSLILVILYLLDKRHDATRKPEPRGTGWLERFMTSITPKLSRYAAIIVIISLVASVVGWVVEEDLENFNGYKGIISQDVQEMKDINHLTEIAGGAVPLDVLIESDNVLDPEMLQWTLDQSNSLIESAGVDAGGYVGSVTSLSHLFVGFLGALPNSAEEAEAYLQMIPEKMWISSVNAEHTALHVAVTSSRAETAELKEVVAAMHEAYDDPPQNATSTVTGLSFLGIKLSEDQEDARSNIKTYGVGFVLLGLLLVFKFNLKRVFIAAFPVLIVLGWSGLFMWVFNMKISTILALLPAQLIAIGIEFTILLLMRYYEERNRGADPIMAMTTALTRIGRAILISGSMLIFGFAVLLFVFDFPVIQDFGLVTVVDTILILLSTLVVLPAIVLAWDTKGMKNKISESAAE